ncbi:unnamed protein product [Mytilus edulis]|uniref:Mab-21-like nucleotidyltransferase domain-containing protein n=1 Tax=Mytilus edulis TaxID=6550 RepID=A0A8S3TTE3_MYTED|nr:unnamed protein product [Mytilus edulis]
MDDDDVDFIDCLIGGGFRHITKEVVAKLLKYKNNIGNTPLHILTMNGVVQERPDTSLIVLQKCFSAGVDINCINNLGESAFHLLIQNTRPEFTFKKKNEEVLKCFIENRADINLQNVFGISPIFHCYSGDVRSFLLEMGADLNIQDKFGRTLLLAMLIYKPSAEEIAKLLVRDVNLNQRDFHGNNALHYAVCHELDSDAVRYMIKSGIESSKDNQGTLPCEQALQQQNRELCRILSDDSNIIYQRYMYEFPNHVIEYKELVRDNFVKTAYVSKCLNLSSTEAFTDLFRLPFIGQQSCEEEADLIRSHITNLIQEIGRKLEGREKYMFGQVCERDKGFCGDSGFTVLKLKENKDQSNHRWFFDRKGRLNVNAVRLRFAQLVKEILYDPVIWTSPYITLHFVTNQDAADEEVLPTCQFTINWVGHQYKDLPIKIDLVPACQISNFWPENTDLQKISCSDDKLQKDGCVLLFQCTEIFEQSEVKLRASAVPAEKRLMETISKIATDSYMFSKLLCTDWVCSEIVIDKESFLVGDFITSYMLKNCTFHVFHDNKMKGIAIEDIRSFTVQIFKTLLSFCETNNFPAFIFPFQNIFDVLRLESEKSVRKKCIHRGICAKIILSILGEKQVFTELREEDIIRNSFLESGSDDEVSMDECPAAVDPLEDFSNHSDYEFEK